MRRRSVIIGGLAGLLLTPEHASTQQPSTKIPRVGILTQGDSERTPMLDALRAGLHDLGYEEGRNVILEFRSARGDPWTAVGGRTGGSVGRRHCIRGPRRPRCRGPERPCSDRLRDFS